MNFQPQPQAALQRSPLAPAVSPPVAHSLAPAPVAAAPATGDLESSGSGSDTANLVGLNEPWNVSVALIPPSQQAAAPQAAPMSPATAQQVFGHVADAPATGGAVAPAGAAPVAAPAVTPIAAPAGAPVPAHVRPDVTAYGAGLDARIDADINGNRISRTLLDGERKSHSPQVATTETQLNGNREALLNELKERTGVFDDAIKGVDAKLGTVGKHPTPEQQALLAEKARLTASEQKYSAQETASQRWHNRGEINGIDEQLKNPALDPKVKADLLAKKKTLATGMLATTTEYQQFDPRWGDTVYGKDKSYTNMREAGCGPTGLADMLDFRDQEDPEGQHAAGHKQTITPRVTADYATNHGRVKGSGTDGVAMMNGVGQAFPGMQGNALQDQTAVNASLNDGVPVMFLGHNVTGQGVTGAHAKPYGGHYMVLNGVSDDGKNYTVLDGGRNDQRNIRTITGSELSGHTNGYWNVNPTDPAKSANNP